MSWLSGSHDDHASMPSRQPSHRASPSRFAARLALDTRMSLGAPNEPEVN
jgi:hypothetical protein